MNGRTWVSIEFCKLNLPVYDRLKKIVDSLPAPATLTYESSSVSRFNCKQLDVNFSIYDGTRLRVEYSIAKEGFVREKVLELIKLIGFKVDRIYGPYYKYRWVHPGEYRLLTDPDAPPPAFFDEAITRNSSGEIIALTADDFVLSKNAETGKWYFHRTNSPVYLEVEPSSIQFERESGEIKYRLKAEQGEDSQQ